MSKELDVDPSELEIADELIAERRAEQPGQTPETMTSWQRPITATIDVINLWVGRVTCLILVPIIASMVYEVVAAKAYSNYRLSAQEARSIFNYFNPVGGDTGRIRSARIVPVEKYGVIIGAKGDVDVLDVDAQLMKELEVDAVVRARFRIGVDYHATCANEGGRGPQVFVLEIAHGDHRETHTGVAPPGRFLDRFLVYAIPAAPGAPNAQ